MYEPANQSVSSVIFSSRIALRGRKMRRRSGRKKKEERKLGYKPLIN